jgi:hypothetical protein
MVAYNLLTAGKPRQQLPNFLGNFRQEDVFLVKGKNWGLSIIRTGSNAKLLVMGVPIEPSENQKPQTLENS